MMTIAPPIASSQPPERRIRQETIALFDACIRVREISLQQLDLAEEIALIATNAEIAAAKSWVNQGAFIVLANETGQIARTMSKAVGQIHQDAAELARTSLVGLEKSRQLDRIHEGRKGIEDPLNTGLVDQVANRLLDLVQQGFASIRTRLDQVDQCRKDLLKQLVRVSRIITYFRIEAARDHHDGAYFQNIADDLTRLCESANAVSEAMQAVLKRSHR